MIRPPLTRRRSEVPSVGVILALVRRARMSMMPGGDLLCGAEVTKGVAAETVRSEAKVALCSRKPLVTS
jgi:hypothetical protein